MILVRNLPKEGARMGLKYRKNIYKIIERKGRKIKAIAQFKGLELVTIHVKNAKLFRYNKELQFLPDSIKKFFIAPHSENEAPSFVQAGRHAKTVSSVHTDIFRFRPEPAQRREEIVEKLPGVLKKKTPDNTKTHAINNPARPDSAEPEQKSDNATKVNDSPPPIQDSPTQSLKSRISDALSKASSLISRRTKRTVRPAKRYIEEF